MYKLYAFRAAASLESGDSSRKNFRFTEKISDFLGKNSDDLFLHS